MLKILLRPENFEKERKTSCKKNGSSFSRAIWLDINFFKIGNLQISNTA
jgi:hypothetical protein